MLTNLVTFAQDGPGPTVCNLKLSLLVFTTFRSDVELYWNYMDPMFLLNLRLNELTSTAVVNVKCVLLVQSYRSSSWLEHKH